MQAHAPVVSQGLSNVTPIGSKLDVLRVTTVRPCIKAVAAMSASRSGRGSGTCKAAHRLAMPESIGKICLWKGASTCRSNQSRNRAPCSTIATFHQENAALQFKHSDDGEVHFRLCRRLRPRSDIRRQHGPGCEVRTRRLYRSDTSIEIRRPKYRSPIRGGSKSTSSSSV